MRYNDLKVGTRVVVPGDDRNGIPAARAVVKTWRSNQVKVQVIEEDRWDAENDLDNGWLKVDREDWPTEIETW